MKFLRFALLFILAFIFYFDGSTQEKKEEKGFLFGILFSPDYSYRYLRSIDNENNWRKFRNEMESARIGFTSGIVVSYQLEKRLALESGIRFSDKGNRYQVRAEDLRTLDGGPALNDPSIPQKYTEKYHYYYLGFPVKLNYFMLKKKVDVFFSIGVSTDFFLSGMANSITEYMDREKENSSKIDADFNKINLMGLLGVGVETNFSSQLQFRAEPVFRYSFTPLVDSSLKEYPYSIGVNFVLFSNF